jgi:elongation factor P--beta-lysine ligase
MTNPVHPRSGQKASESSPWWDRDRHQDRRHFLQIRGQIKRALRAWFEAQGFTEVETGQLQVSPGNETHLHGFETERIWPDGTRQTFYLHTSPEFAAKKLLAAGETRIFEFARVFRNREAGPLHASEFTMLEWYRAGADWTEVMADTLAILSVAAQAAGTHVFSWRGVDVPITVQGAEVPRCEADGGSEGFDASQPQPGNDSGQSGRASLSGSGHPMPITPLDDVAAEGTLVGPGSAEAGGIHPLPDGSPSQSQSGHTSLAANSSLDKVLHNRPTEADTTSDSRLTLGVMTADGGGADVPMASRLKTRGKLVGSLPVDGTSDLQHRPSPNVMGGQLAVLPDGAAKANTDLGSGIIQSRAVFWPSHPEPGRKSNLVAQDDSISGHKPHNFNILQTVPPIHYERITLCDAFSSMAGIDLDQNLDLPADQRLKHLANAAKDGGIAVSDDDTWSDIFSKVLVERIEPFLGYAAPCILCHYPAEEAALARRSPDDTRLAERFEVYVAGVELANGFGELTDPVEQRARFEADMDLKERIYGERYPLDEELLRSLEHMPTSSGVALGFDRLVMLASGARRIDDVLWTPPV